MAGQLITYFNTAVCVVLSLVLWYKLARQFSKETIWAALAFSCLGVLTVTGLFAMQMEPQDVNAWVQRISIGLLILFPYFLYLFTVSLIPARGRLTWFFSIATGALIVWAMFIHIPVDQASRAIQIVYTVGFLANWSALLLVVSYKFWQQGRSKASVIRHRLHLLAIASAGMSLALLFAIPVGEKENLFALGVDMLGALSLLLFYIGFQTPQALRVLWRVPESEKTRTAIGRLMTIQTVKELEEIYLPTIPPIVGGDAAAIIGLDDQPIALYNVSNEKALQALKEEDRYVTHLNFPFGKMLVWSSPHTPFFGKEEVDMLRSVGAVTGLALDRCRSFEQELKAIERLKELNRLKDEFVSMASHELRTPLTSIVGFTSTLRHMRDRLTIAQQDEFLGIIDDQSQRLARLVEDLLTLSRIESGRLKRQAVEVDIPQAVAKAARSLSPMEVAFESEGPTTAFVDPHHLHQILVNYLTNASRYGEAPYTVVSRNDGDIVNILVRDQGEGVAKEFIAHLFDRFATGPNSSQGTGLGLSIVRALAEEYDGSAWYEYTHEGPAFGVSLPAQSVDG